MALLKPLARPVPRPIPSRRLPKGKAVTIGVGFTCQQGIVLGADTQITCDGFHKYYEHKIYSKQTSAASVAFTFSGDPGLMKSFCDRFFDALDSARELKSIEIEQWISGILGEMEEVKATADLSMLAGIVLPSKEFRLLRTDAKKVYRIPSGFIGVGDSSLIRYLMALLTQSAYPFSLRQAELLSFYIVQQAKNWIDGCGGETDVLFLRSDGRIEPSGKIPSGVEAHFGIMERHITRIAEAFLYEHLPAEEFDKRLESFFDVLKKERSAL